MKKIGICTLHFANNFGAILQAFALQETVKNLGYDVEFLKLKDFAQEIGLHNFDGYENSKTHLNISKEIYDKEKHYYDAIIIGSDELWNLNNDSFEHLDEYFGVNLNTDKIISYAPSANGTTIEKLEEIYEDKVRFEEFHELSARDKKTQQLIKDVSGRDSTLVLDPTFLVESFDKYAKYKTPELKDYIIIYGYSYSEDEKRKIIDFAKTKNKKIYALGFKMDWCEFLPANIFEFLGYVKNADYVITNTFHGLVFSIILEKEFAIFSNGRTKIIDLIEKFDLEKRDVTYIDDLSTVFDEKIDYSTLNKIKLIERERSFNYLKNALQ